MKLSCLHCATTKSIFLFQGELMTQTELEKSLRSNIRETVVSYLSTNNTDLSPDSLLESDITKTFQEICNYKKMITSDKEKKFDDILHTFIKCIENLEYVKQHPSEEQTSLRKGTQVLNVMDLQSMNYKGCLATKEHNLPDILERLVASIMISSSSTLPKNAPIKDVMIPKVDVSSTGDLIEGYKKKFQSIEQNLKDEVVEVRYKTFVRVRCILRNNYVISFK